MDIRFDLVSWFLHDPEVRPSSIVGSGLFLAGHVSKGDVVMRLGGRFVGLEQRIDNDYIIRSTTTGISEDLMLAKPVGTEKDPSDWINHSCNSNLRMRDAITLEAKYDIPKGTEVTCDYAYWEADEAYVMRQVCRCGTRNCRGMITGMDWRLPPNRADIDAHGAPFIRRRIAKVEGRE